MNFEEMYKIDVNEHTEEKNGLKYLSWAYAWKEFKQAFPKGNYKILPVQTFADGTMMVWTEASNGEETLQMWLPVMDYRNKAISNPDAFAINKAIMRCLTKNLAMFGLGLYIYAGEDLPEAPAEELITDKQLGMLSDLGCDFDRLAKAYKVANVKEMTKKQADDAIKIKMGTKNVK